MRMYACMRICTFVHLSVRECFHGATRRVKTLVMGGMLAVCRTQTPDNTHQTQGENFRKTLNPTLADWIRQGKILGDPQNHRRLIVVCEGIDDGGSRPNNKKQEG